jgi:hypothetical protein
VGRQFLGLAVPVRVVLVQPVIVSVGQRLFKEGVGMGLRLLDTWTLARRVVFPHYAAE